MRKRSASIEKRGNLGRYKTSLENRMMADSQLLLERPSLDPPAESYEGTHAARRVHSDAVTLPPIEFNAPPLFNV
jgi:hypothetical protein